MDASCGSDSVLSIIDAISVIEAASSGSLAQETDRFELLAIPQVLSAVSNTLSTEQLQISTALSILKVARSSSLDGMSFFSLGISACV